MTIVIVYFLVLKFSDCSTMSCDNYGIIAHYQKIIKRARNDEQKLHYCIEKLFGLPITIEHLQKTGIGKTINSLRKYNGEVGTAAKALVAKWKAMIADLDVGQNKDVMDKHVGIDDRLKKNNQTESGQNSNTQINLINGNNKTRLEPCGNTGNKSNNANSHNLKSNSSKKHGIRSPSDAFHSGPEKKSDKMLHENQHYSKQKAEIQESGEIDYSMGASFSDALVMCCGDNNKKTKNLKRHSLERNSVKLLPKQKKSSYSDTIAHNDLPTPTQDIDNSLSLPKNNVALKIVDNYSPNVGNQKIMKHIYSPSYKEKANIAKVDVLSVGISSKTKRTKVYSGVKTGALLNVPSLFDICIRVLQKNIDALEFTGGVPFDVLRPVLERTSPQQLLAVENFNSYLLEDTDFLWEQHVKRNFRKDKKQDDETWREMFMRCENEKEYRLSILTTNIKKAQRESALPVRKTRLAYVDHAAKPPRNILRKQEIFGTNLQVIASPAARVPSLSSSSSNVVKVGDPRLKNVKHMHTGGNTQIQPRRAPLMAKTLKFIKKRYKR